MNSLNIISYSHILTSLYIVDGVSRSQGLMIPYTEPIPFLYSRTMRIQPAIAVALTLTVVGCLYARVFILERIKRLTIILLTARSLQHLTFPLKVNELILVQ